MVQTKLCIVTHTFLPHVGGIEKVVNEQSKRLLTRNFEPMIVTNRIGTPKHYVVDGVNVECYESLNTGFRLGIPYSIPTVPSFGTFLKAVKSSKIVHAHGHPYLTSLIAAKLAKRYNKPFVLTQHNTFIEYDNIFDKIERLNDLAVGKETLKEADKIITVSYAMKEDLSKHGWQSSKISVVWNGVDAKRYDPINVSKQEIEQIRNKYGIPTDWNMLLFVGRLAWVKGVRNLLQAMPLVLKEFPNTKLVILGRGEEQGDIVETADRMSIKDNIVYRFDFVSEQERILHYAASDVCVFPSTYEPFGIVSLEAMAMEKPVVVGARGVVGFKEQIINGGPDQNGVHVNGEDPADIAWGIMQTLRDPEKAKNWGENGRRRVLEYFTWQKVAEQTIKIYESLL